jgi:hypothetical protein
MRGAPGLADIAFAPPRVTGVQRLDMLGDVLAVARDEHLSPSLRNSSSPTQRR